MEAYFGGFDFMYLRQGVATPVGRGMPRPYIK